MTAKLLGRPSKLLLETLWDLLVIPKINTNIIADWPIRLTMNKAIIDSNQEYLITKKVYFDCKNQCQVGMVS